MKIMRSKGYKLKVETTLNKVKCETVDEFIENIRKLYPIKASKENVKTKKEVKKVLYVNGTYPMSLDIETSKVKFKSGTTGSTIYAYTICIMDCVVTVRTRNDLEILLSRIANEWLASDELKELDIYKEMKKDGEVKYVNLKVGVHNLPFEFWNIFGEWSYGMEEKEINEKLQPFFLKGSLAVVSHPTLPITFVDTHKLFNTSLRTAIENEVHEPELSIVKKGEMNHDIIRTPNSELDDSEKNYIWNDCLGLTAAISSVCKQYESTWNTLPLTKTGCTTKLSRKVVREFAGTEKRKSEIAEELTRGTLTMPQLILNKKSLQGGISAVNDSYKNVRVNEEVGHVDFTSFHPSNMMYQKFPVGKNYDLNADQFAKLVVDRENKGFIATLVFYDVKLKDGVVLPFKGIDEKDELINHTTKNGRLESAEFYSTTFNSVDFDLFNQQYDYKIVEFVSGFGFRMKHMYDEFRQMLALFYRQKVLIKKTMKEICEGTLTGNLSQLNIKYNLSKNNFNGQFGKTAQTPIFSSSKFEITNGVMTTSQARFENVEESYAKYKNRNLKYNEKDERWEHKLNDIYDLRWGTFISAYSHAGLIDLVEAIGDEAWIKSDTDSAYYVKSKVKDKNFIENINKKVTELALEAGIPEDWYNIEGEFLGHLSVEADLASFIAKGPKQHQEVFKDGSYEYTNAGISKEALRRAHELGVMNYDDEIVKIGEEVSGLFAPVRVANQPIGEVYKGTDGTFGVVDNAQGYYLKPVSFKIKG